MCTHWVCHLKNVLYIHELKLAFELQVLPIAKVKQEADSPKSENFQNILRSGESMQASILCEPWSMGRNESGAEI